MSHSADLSTSSGSSLAQRLFATSAGWAPLAPRIAAGVIFTAHGAQKLFGAFGGYGLEGTGQFMASIGLNPGTLMALLAGSAEFFGGLALLLGLLVRPAALVLAFTMLVAIFGVHINDGLFMPKGYEFALSLLAISVGLAISGAGQFSLDRVIAQRLSDGSGRDNAGAARPMHLSRQAS